MFFLKKDIPEEALIKIGFKKKENKKPMIIGIKYEKLSMQTCIMCGKPGKLTDNGWIMPLCKDCEEKGWE